MNKRRKKIRKRIFRTLFLIVFVLCISHCRTIIYGVEQGVGQAGILCNAQNIDEAMNDSTFADSLKPKLLLVREIKQFAEDSLGLKKSENYTTVYDQKGEPILWLVVASKPYEIKPYEWSFPIVGSFKYLGFFKKKKAKKEAISLREKGYETRIGTVTAWSTLGYFKDPVFTDILNRSEGQIARVIIHELTHGTLFVKDSLEFNENLATFVGDDGAAYYLEQKYGRNSEQYIRYLNELDDLRKFSEHILRGALRLDSLYSTFPDDLAVEMKDSLKHRMIKDIVWELDTMSFLDNYLEFDKLKTKEHFPNNAFFINYLTYRSKQNALKQEFEEDFNRDFIKYINYIKSKYEK